MFITQRTRQDLFDFYETIFLPRRTRSSRSWKPEKQFFIRSFSNPKSPQIPGFLIKSLGRDRFSLAHGLWSRLVQRYRFNRNDLDIAIRQCRNFASFFTEQRLADGGLIGNDVPIRIAVPSAENRVGLLLFRLLVAHGDDRTN